MAVSERAAAATVHGRYLIIPPEAAGSAPILAGFHGYAEDAETQMERLRAIPGNAHFLCISIQGLHAFYQRRTSRVVASWMTRQNRDLAIADNVAYVSRCIESAASEWTTAPRIVFAGFSQGVAMAFRAAVSPVLPVAGVIAVGGDIPPEISTEALARVPTVLICRGNSDPWYSEEKFRQDQSRLQDAGVQIQTLEFEGGHDWSAEVTENAGRMLQSLAP